MIPLEQYCTKWRLTGPHKIAETPTSLVYRVEFDEKPAALKILTPLGRRSEANGAKTLACYAGNGAARLFDADEGAQLLQFAEGPGLKSLVSEGKDGEATGVVCEVVRRLHDYSGPLPAHLPSMTSNFKALFETAKACESDQCALVQTLTPGTPDLIREAAHTATRLLDTERDVRLLHGDLHHTNIMASSSHGWLAIDPKGLVGERTYDLANVFYNPDDMPSLVEQSDRIERLSKAFAKRLDLPQKRILEYAFAYGALSACWAMEDGLNPSRRLRIAKLIRETLLFEQ